MNYKNRNARYASMASNDYFTFLFFKDKNIIDKGIINGILSNGFTILVKKYGFEGLIEFDKNDLIKN